MKSLPNIPAPVGALWREARVRIVPVLLFGLLVWSIVGLWTRVNRAQTLAGVGEGVRSLVTSPQTGWLLEVKVKPYQLVNQGDPLAVIQPVDSRMLLDLLQSEVQLARLRFQPAVADQNAMNYERIRVELLRMKSELAIAKVNLQRAQNEVERNRPLYLEKLVSEDVYDLSLKTHEAFQAEVTEKTRGVEELERQMASLRSLGDPQVAPKDARLEALLERLEATQSLAASNWGPITLVAPISGMVAAISRQPGEYLMDGEPVLNVHSLWSDRVVGYLRQPYPVDPQVGLDVKITTRTRSRQQFWSSVAQVGAQVEVITNALAYVRQGALVDVGLPIIIEVPPAARIRPGEIVDLWIKPPAANREIGHTN